MVNKKALLSRLVEVLTANYQMGLTAAKRAHSTATDKANIAENKYDTLGLEAAYLAEGHANHAAQCKADLETIKKLSANDFLIDDAIDIGALVTLKDQDDKPLSLLLSPVSGGVKFDFNNTSILVITPSSPLGRKLIGKYVEDELEIGAGKQKKQYTITKLA